MDFSHFFSSIPVIYRTAALLVLSNLFMSFAWYAHLKNLSNAPIWIAILSSWGVALFEYSIMVPANRLGFTDLSLGQLKILQEVVSLSVFIPFCRLLHEGAAETGLPLGRTLHTRRSLLHVPR